MDSEHQQHRHRHRRARNRGGEHKSTASRPRLEQPKQKSPPPPRRKRRRPVKGGVPRKVAGVASLSSGANAGSLVQRAKKKDREKQPEREAEIWNVEVCPIAMRNSQVMAWSGPVKVLVTASEMVEAVREILASGETHLGFDTETRPNYVKGGWNKTALVQIATADVVYLFRICRLPGHSFDPLLPILTNPNISKTGVSIHDDVRELQKVRNFKAAGFVDTTTITRNVLRIKNGGLSALTYHFLGGRLAKGAAQMSNWATMDELSAAQIRYAATDAWASREVHARAVAVTQAEEF